MSTNTTNYNLVKPTKATDNADIDVVNANMDAIDTQMKANAVTAAAALPKSGGAMTGPLILAADPTVALGAVTKQHAENIPVNAMSRQGLINANFDVWQRGISFSTTNAYTADRWQLFHNHTAVTATQQASFLPDGSRNNMRLTNVTRGTGSYFEILQAIETANCLAFINKNCTLSFQVRKSSGLAAGDVVAKIMYTTVNDDAGINVANGVAVGTVTVPNASMTTSFQNFSVTATVPANARTLGVLLILNNSPTDGQYVEFSQVQLCQGSAALPFQPRSYGEELKLCERYCYLTTAANASGSYTKFAIGQVISATQAVFSLQFPEMRIPPTLVTSAAATFTLSDPTFSASKVVSAISAGIKTNKIMELTITCATGLTAGDATTLSANATTTAFILLESEI